MKRAQIVMEYNTIAVKKKKTIEKFVTIRCKKIRISCNNLFDINYIYYKNVFQNS